MADKIGNYSPTQLTQVVKQTERELEGKSGPEAKKKAEQLLSTARGELAEDLKARDGANRADAKQNGAVMRWVPGTKDNARSRAALAPYKNEIAADKALVHEAGALRDRTIAGPAVSRAQTTWNGVTALKTPGAREMAEAAVIAQSASPNAAATWSAIMHASPKLKGVKRRKRALPGRAGGGDVRPTGQRGDRHVESGHERAAAGHHEQL